MKKLRLFTHYTLLATTPSLLAYPQQPFLQAASNQNDQSDGWTRPVTYDGWIQMLEDLESGQLEKRYSAQELEQINEYLVHLAEIGVLRSETEEVKDLEKDSYELLSDEGNAFALMDPLEDSYEYALIPAILDGSCGYEIALCGGISKGWKKSKKFVKKHKKAIIIGVAILVVATIITIAIVSGAPPPAETLGPAVGGVVAASSSEANSTSSERDDVPTLQSTLEEQVSILKDNFTQEELFSSADGCGLRPEETGKVVSALLERESLAHLDHYLEDPELFQELQRTAYGYLAALPLEEGSDPIGYGYPSINERPQSNDTPPSYSPEKTDFKTLFYQERGEAAHRLGYHREAIDDLDRAIERNPADPALYLERSLAHSSLGQYEEAIKDFESFRARTEQLPEKALFSTQEFTRGLTKGVIKGIRESEKGALFFIEDLITHPVQTATQMYDGLSTLAELARNNEWEAAGKSLSPEIDQLVTQWDILSVDEKGELAGYALGKYGGEFPTVSTTAEEVTNSTKTGKKLAKICEKLQKIEEILVVETMAGVGDVVKVKEVLNAGKTSA